MRYSILTVLALASLNARADVPPAAPDGCFRYAGESLQDAASDAIMNGSLDKFTSNLPCLKELVARGLDLGKNDSNWGSDQTSVEEAAHAGNAEILEFILSQGVGIGNRNDPIAAGNLADIAAVGGSVEVMKLLQARGLPIFYRNPKWPHAYMKPSNYFLESCSPTLMEAIAYLRVDLVKYLLGQGVDVNARCGADSAWMDNDGYPTPLMALANSVEAFDNINGDVAGRRAKANELIGILIDAGADVHAREDYFGRSAGRQLLDRNWINPEMKAFVSRSL